MSTLSENIKYCRMRQGMTQAELAKACGMSGYKAIQAWEYGVATPRPQTFSQLCELFGESMHDMYNNRIQALDAERAARPKNIETIPDMERVPIVGTIACGVPITAEQNLDGYAYTPAKNCTFALRCKGDSMIGANIRDGALVFVHEQPDVENGQIAAVQIDNEATLKRVYKFAGHVLLHPENPKYKDMIYDASNTTDFRILGLAVSYTDVVH